MYIKYIKYNEFDAIDNHKLKCKYCGRFMVHTGTNAIDGSTYDSYKCNNPKCMAAADVCNDDSEHDVFWSE